MSHPLLDLRSAARGLSRQPGLFARRVALGIGGNSAIFSGCWSW